MATIIEYKSMIKKATTKDELSKVSYAAMSNKDNKMWDKVINLCIKREIELGLIKIT